MYVCMYVQCHDKIDKYGRLNNPSRTNLGEQRLFVWICAPYSSSSIKTGTRRIVRLDER